MSQEEINEFEVYANQMKELSEQWKDDYYRMYAKFLSTSNKASELEIENNKLKNKLKEAGIKI